MRRAVVATLGALVVAGAFGAYRRTVRAEAEAPPAGYKFTLARIRFSTPGLEGFDFGGFGPPWRHDFPTSERHFMKILSEVTRLDVNADGHIVSFDSDEVFRYPVAYLCEVGFLDLSDREAHNLAQYLQRGGFLIVDDFRGERDLDNLKRQFRRVFPDRALEELPRSHPIFNCFYDISALYPPPPYAPHLVPQYFGISDDKGRLVAVIDYNNDISEYWEWSDNPLLPIERTNEAYKYGVNYVMYALTH